MKRALKQTWKPVKKWPWGWIVGIPAIVVAGVGLSWLLVGLVDDLAELSQYTPKEIEKIPDDTDRLNVAYQYLRTRLQMLGGVTGGVMAVVGLVVAVRRSTIALRQAKADAWCRGISEIWHGIL